MGNVPRSTATAMHEAPTAQSSTLGTATAMHEHGDGNARGTDCAVQSTATAMQGHEAREGRELHPVL